MNVSVLVHFGRAVMQAAQIKASRRFLDLFADRVRQAATEPTLGAFGQRLCTLMQVSVGELDLRPATAFLALSASPDEYSALAWVRANHTMYTVLCASSPEDAADALATIDAPAADVMDDEALPRRPYHIGLRMTCLTPLSHGADGKAGNATLFRRMSVLGQRGSTISLPYYAGNAIRGQMRDILADHFTSALGLIPRRDKPPYALWFFHALYAGGALEEKSASTKAVTAALGDHGALRSDGVRAFRDALPAISLLGVSMGNRVLSGHTDFGDLRPVCREWGNGGTSCAAELTEWLYLTRREDHEGHDENHSMIAVTEALKPGTVLEGGIDLRLHTSDLSRSALGVGLRELAARGRIGAGARMDYGSVAVEVANAPDPEAYEAYLRDNRHAVLDYLDSIGALNARDVAAV